MGSSIPAAGQRRFICWEVFCVQPFRLENTPIWSKHLHLDSYRLETPWLITAWFSTSQWCRILKPMKFSSVPSKDQHAQKKKGNPENGTGTAMLHQTCSNNKTREGWKNTLKETNFKVPFFLAPSSVDTFFFLRYSKIPSAISLLGEIPAVISKSSPSYLILLWSRQQIMTHN